MNYSINHSVVAHATVQSFHSVNSQNTEIKFSAIESIESKLALMEYGSHASIVKSLRSARHFIIRSLVTKGENVVSLNSDDIIKDKDLYQRFGIKIMKSSKNTATDLSTTVDNYTKLIYLETIDQSDLSIPDFLKIFAFAKERKIPVVVDNTAGAVGYIFKPLFEGASYVIGSTENWPAFPSAKIGAYIVENKNDIKYSINDKLKKSINRNYLQRIAALSLSLSYTVDQLYKHFKKQHHATLYIAQWLKKQIVIQDVGYNGLTSHPYFIETVKYFTHGYGNQIIFRVKGQKEGFDRLKVSLIPKSDQNFVILFKEEEQQIVLTLQDEHAENAIEVLERAFEQVQRDLGEDIVF